MNSRNIKKLLFDVEKACSRILKFTNDVPILLDEIRTIMSEI